MAPRGMIAVTTVLLCFILGLLGPAPAALGSQMGKACCTRYNRKPVPFQRIKGYREQTTKENCRIEAIIFYTVKKNEICATRKDEWVRKILELLSSKLMKMSMTGSAAGEKE
ncbi:C-C motif chemokine 20-like [Anoplopoma fimbria]|uniref:C-C motif chemokine 20-like n=1 Tax=Anoplopoma fimbria TaxID=229290 RepID=UPI0023EDBBC6|nr:C-C motif chemokine 20-like [Anoplopoma fimbria]